MRWPGKLAETRAWQPGCISFPAALGTQRENTAALAGAARLVGHRPTHRKVVDSIPRRGAYKKQPINVSLPLPLSLPVSLKAMTKMSSGED